MAHILLVFGIQMIVVLFRDTALTRFIGLVTLGITYLAHIFQLEIGTLTVGQRIVFLQRNLFVHAVVVSTVVGDVQFTIATYHRQVATTIEATRMLGTHGDEVLMVDIVECSRCIAEYRRSVGIGLVAVRRYVTTRKHGIIDMYATLFLIAFRAITRKQVGP